MIQHRCPLTYQLLLPGEMRYSRAGLRRLAPNLGRLEVLPYAARQLRDEAIARAGKLSIPGVQPKLSARLSIARCQFELFDRGGTFILKPPHADFRSLPENEDLTMRLAATVGIPVPLHGLIYGADEQLTYCIKRFDRHGHGKKRALEDFAQLAGRTRDTKYDWSMERLVGIVDQFCTFPVPARQELLHRTLFCYLVGNEDMHLKNFSLLERDGIVALSPAYDLLNTTIAVPGAREELALPLKGKKRGLRRADLLDYFGHQRLGLNRAVTDHLLATYRMALPSWPELIRASFLPQSEQDRYLELVGRRARVLELPTSAGWP